MKKGNSRPYRDEADYQKAIIGSFKRYGWLLQPHRDSVSDDIPDLSFSGNGINGWIEVKYLKKVTDSPDRDLQHFTGGQQKWLQHHGKAGGYCYLWVGSLPRHLVLPWNMVHQVRTATWATLERYSIIAHQRMDVLVDFMASALYRPVSESARNKDLFLNPAPTNKTR